MNKISRRNFVRLAGSGLAASTVVSLVPAEPAAPQATGHDAGVAVSCAPPCASSFRIAPPSGADAGIFLSPAALSMPQPQIGFTGRDLRLYSQRGSTSFRGRTVTGLKAMIYPPLNLSDPQIAPPLGLSESGFFNLAFREEQTGTLIQDIQDEFADPLYLDQKPRSANQLGPVYKHDESSSILLSQDAQWWPHCYIRTGIFNRRMAGKLISFHVECRVFLSAVEDEIYEEIDLRNRSDEPLSLTIIPDQPRPADPQQGVRKPMFQRQEGDFTVEAVSDIGPADKDGWRVDLSPQGTCTVRIALLLKPKAEPATPSYHLPDLAGRVKKSIVANVGQLQWASSQLPQIHTANAMLDEFYKRSILSVLFCRQVRELLRFAVLRFWHGPGQRGGLGHLLFQPHHCSIRSTGIAGHGGGFPPLWRRA